MIRHLPIFCALALGVGCVPKGKYDAALADSQELTTQLSGAQANIGDLTAQIERLNAELAATRGSLDQTSRTLASKTAEAGQLQEDVVKMQQALVELELRKQRAEAAMQSYRDLVGRFRAMIDAGTLEVKVIDGRMVVELATDILFPPGSASLSKDGEKAIRDVAQVLASIPEREFQVAGHTDDVPISTERFPSNWHLGAARAISVTQLMTQAGLPPQRVSAASFAEHRPLDTNRTKEGKANNRRIEIIVVPDMSTLPGYDELRSVAEGDPATGAEGGATRKP